MISSVDSINRMREKFQAYENGPVNQTDNAQGNNINPYREDGMDMSDELKDSQPAPPEDNKKKEGSGIGKMLLGIGLGILNTVLGGLFGGGGAGGGGEEKQAAGACGGGG